MTRQSRRLVALLAAVVALGSGGAAAAVALRSPAGTEAAYAPIDAAVLSPRRAPTALRELIADTRLVGRLNAFVASLAGKTCAVVDAGSARLVAINPDEPLIPASALKLTTAAAFLAKLGGTDTFTTTVRGPKPDSNGTVTGDIALVGDGDPLLATQGYVSTRRRPPTPATLVSALAKKLVAAGVRRVTGGIDVSDSRYDAERRVPSWKPGYTTSGDVGPLGALAVDDGFVAYSPRVQASGDPAIAAGDALKRELAAVGVVVDGPTTRDAASGAVLASIDSAPFKDVVAEMLRESDNNSAELMLKELAAAAGMTPATRAAGAAARVAALRDLGVDADAIQAIDGSGLDRSNRASCAALIMTLRAKPGGYDVASMLALAGRTGTLSDRFTTSPLAGKLRAKTGSLDDVTALVGVADPDALNPLRFAFISNGPFDEAGGRALQDRLVAALASYPEAPDSTTLGL